MVLLWIFLTPVALVALGISGCELRKAYYDREVRSLCEKDGGVRVEKQIPISRTLADQLPHVDGKIAFSSEILAPANVPAFDRTTEKYILQGNLSIVRYEQSVIRRSDGHTVARIVSYGRGGGDFPSHASASSFSCPDQKSLLDGMQKIYLVTEEVK